MNKSSEEIISVKREDNGNKLFVLPKLTNIITETAESIAESECNRNADSITEMASFITDATK